VNDLSHRVLFPVREEKERKERNLEGVSRRLIGRVLNGEEGEWSGRN